MCFFLFVCLCGCVLCCLVLEEALVAIVDVIAVTAKTDTAAAGEGTGGTVIADLPAARAAGRGRGRGRGTREGVYVEHSNLRTLLRSNISVGWSVGTQQQHS